MPESYNKIFIKKTIEDFQNGKKELAFNNLRDFVIQNPRDGLANYNLGFMSQELKKIEEAKKYYNESIKIDPKNWQAKFNLYLILIKEREYEKSLSIINSVLLLKKNYQPALRDKALVLNYLKRPEEGLKYIVKSIEINKKDYIAINILGLIHKTMNKFEKAITAFQKAININSNYLASYNNLSSCYSLRHEFITAENILLKALDIDNEAFETINNLANVYSQTGRYDKAIIFYNKALIKAKDRSDILYNIGVAYFFKKDFDLSEKYYKEAYKLDPYNDILKKNYALLLLAQQKYKDAWLIYDGRLNLSDFLFKNSTLNNVKDKLWNNQVLKKGDKILIIKEQGIGDEILFSSMYPELIKSFPNCYIETEKRLLNLFKNSFVNNNNFIEFGKISKKRKLLTDIDHIIYAGSLGKIYRNNITDFPLKNYLKASDLDKNLTSFLLKFKNQIKVGISWKSKALIGTDKSINLEDFKPILLNKKFTFFNLQYYDSEEEIKVFEKENSSIKINNLEKVDLYNDFDSIASFLKKLDIFITVSNSTAHLSAALGVPTWIIKPKNHAVLHYWNQKSNKTPWYPSVKLYDQLDPLTQTIDNINKDLIKKFINY